MAEIQLQNIAHSYATGSASTGDYALRPSDYVWDDGGAYALLGPSGCGKTTLLNIISGLLQPSEGKVVFDGVDVTERSTKDRNIAQVFQFPVIYDSMTVFDNLAFPLRNRKIPEKEVRLRVEEIAEMLELSDDLKIRAKGLTADAKQTISLGRGLVRKDVAAILFDEPLTVIDPHLKFILRRKLKQIHERFKLTLVYVTHDQSEALTFADKVVVMSAGEVVQTGTPQELFEEPAHTFVGHFIGSPGMNFISCALDQSCVVVEGNRIPINDTAVKMANGKSGNMQLGIRPEFLRLTSIDSDKHAAVEITNIEDLGNYQIATVLLGKNELKIKVDEDTSVKMGKGFVHFPMDMTKLYINDRLVG